MQVKNIVAAALLATASSALPKPPSGEDGILFFQVMAIRPGSAIQYAAFQAARNNLWLKLPHQNASCDRPDENRATFALNNGSLYLYAESETPQELFVDRSGMGQGVLGYTTGAQPAPSKAERQGWVVDSDNHLTFGGGAGFIACPFGNATDAPWSLWISAGFNNPGGNQGCVGIDARVLEVQNPNGCLYTQRR